MWNKWEIGNQPPRDGSWFVAKSVTPNWECLRIVHYADKYDRLPVDHSGDIWESVPTHWTTLKEYSQIEHHKNLLGQALGEVLVTTGICVACDMTGPELLLMANSYVESKKHNTVEKELELIRKMAEACVKFDRENLESASEYPDPVIAKCWQDRLAISKSWQNYCLDPINHHSTKNLMEE